MKATPRRRKAWLGPFSATVISVSLVLAVTVSDATRASAAARKHSTASHGAVVTMAEGAQGTPNNIMPFVSGANNSAANTNLQEQMWPTLYTIGTAKNVNALNAPLSLAEAPVSPFPDALRLGVEEVAEADLPGGARIVLCCRSGIRAWRAARALLSERAREVALVALGD